MNRIAGKWQAIVLATLVITAATFVVSVFLKPLYRSEAKILVSCKAVAKADFCSSQAAGHIGEIFSQAATTTSFFAELEKSSRPFAEDLPKEQGKNREFWQERISVDNERSGVVHIIVYDRSRKNADNLLLAVVETLQANASKYFPEADSITLTTIDGPIIYPYPAKPNVLANTFWGFAIGLVVSILAFSNWDKRSAKRMETEEFAARNWSPVNFSGQFGERRSRPIFKGEEAYPIMKKEDVKPEERRIFSAIPTFKPMDRKDVPVSQPEKTVVPKVKTVPGNAQIAKPETAITGDVKKPTAESSKQSEPAGLIKPLSTIRFASPKEAPKSELKVEKKDEAKDDQPKNESVKPTLEVVKQETDALSKVVSGQPKLTFPEKKADAPDNLPVFEGDPDAAWKTPAAVPTVPASPSAKEPAAEMQERKAEKRPVLAVERKESSGLGQQDKEKPQDKQDEKTLVEIKEEREPSEEEIKQRLNKLLRGEL